MGAPDEPSAQSIVCDGCDKSLSHTIRIKCAAKGCEDVDLCPSCFCAGKTIGEHKPWHDYRVIEQHPYPIFTEDWGADEELLLVEGIMLHGTGNWASTSEYVGTRTMEECETHYREVYQESPTWPYPRMDLKFDINPEVFHERKRQRIAAARRAALIQATETTDTKKPPPTSGPTNHEISGYMPGRLEFETEIENDAEEPVKDMDFGVVLDYGGGDQPAAPPPPGSEPEDGEVNPSNEPPQIESKESLALKLSLLDIYYEKLDKREEAKEFVFDRGMTDFKKWQAHEKKRPREERDLINKHKPFAKLQTAPDFENFMNGVMQEGALRARIAELQDYRRQGITTFSDGDKFVKERIARLTRPPPTARDIPRLTNGINRASMPPDLYDPNGLGGPDNGLMAASLNGSGTNTGPKAPRRPPQPLNLANAASLHLLTPAEQTLCSHLRILPKPYLVIKETLVSEFHRRAARGIVLRRREARDLVRIDVNKTARIWDYLESVGLLGEKKEERLGVVANSGTGAGVAPPIISVPPSINGSGAPHVTMNGDVVMNGVGPS